MAGIVALLLAVVATTASALRVIWRHRSKAERRVWWAADTNEFLRTKLKCLYTVVDGYAGALGKMRELQARMETLARRAPARAQQTLPSTAGCWCDFFLRHRAPQHAFRAPMGLGGVPVSRA